MELEEELALKYSEGKVMEPACTFKSRIPIRASGHKKGSKTITRIGILFIVRPDHIGFYEHQIE